MKKRVSEVVARIQAGLVEAKPRLSYQLLEPRMVFDAALAATTVEATKSAAHDAAANTDASTIHIPVALRIAIGDKVPR